MLRYILIMCVSVYYVSGVVNPGPKFPPTKGKVWPQPQVELRDNKFYKFSSALFEVKIKYHNCTILANAIDRYISILQEQNVIARRYRRKKMAHQRSRKSTNRRIEIESLSKYEGNLRQLDIELVKPCENYPQFEMDEIYDLSVNAAVATLRSKSIWGILRGLETFVQLFYLSDDLTELRINRTLIHDYPRYKYRGLLLDTARHYISVANILKTMEAMAINKMNVFHWHIVDDQSFPYQSELFPDLSDGGAYHPTMVYTKSDVKLVIQYARDRGIRVVPEFDVPGHTRSWGVAYPSVLTTCYKDNKTQGLGPMNPIKVATYKLLRDFFQEIQEVFPDRSIHIGGDEIDLSCWQSNPDITEFMKINKIQNVTALHALFMQRIIKLLPESTKIIVWQEVFDNDVPLQKDSLIQVWKYDWINKMIQVLLAGHRVLFSSTWYLDYLNNGFKELYTADPRQMVQGMINDSLLQNIVGGEACMWGEMVDDRNVFSRTWPRASAVAEVLWSATRSNQAIPEETFRRIEEHACRMVHRGVPAEPPNGPGFCIT